MVKNIVKIIASAVLGLAIAGCASEAKVEKKSLNPKIHVMAIDNKDGKYNPKSISAAFEKNGYTVADNRDMNDPYSKQFQKTFFKSYNLFTGIHNELSKKLMAVDSINGIFTPFSMGIWEQDGMLMASFLDASALLEITGSTVSKELYEQLVASNIAVFKNEFNASEVALDYAPIAPTGPLVSKFVLSVDAEDYSDAKDDLEMMLEEGLKPKGFVMANFNDFADEMSDSGYDFFQSYSICKLKVIFSVHQARPEAGAFAPCSLVMSKKTGSEEIEIAFPSVYNWMSILNITDQTVIDELLKAQKDMEKILKEATE